MERPVATGTGLDGVELRLYLSAAALRQLPAPLALARSNHEAKVGTGYKVSVSKDFLSFASAHFITFRGHRCEALHGHNYRVAATVEGTLDPECLFVVDFRVLKDVLRRLVVTLDHKVLLPTTNEKLTIRTEGERVTVAVLGEPTYVFPTRDCALIPIANTTAELLAAYLASAVRTELEDHAHSHLTALEIEVEESFGQSATYCETMG